MSRFFNCITMASFFLSAALADGQAEPARKLIVKVDPGDLPENARLRLGRLGGFRYNGSFTTAVMSPDGSRLVVASNDNSITVLDPASGKTIQRIQQQLVGGGQGGMSVSADGSTLAIQTFQSLHIWDIATGKQLQQFAQRNFGGRGDTPALSRDGKIIGIGSQSIGVPKDQKGEVKAFDVTSGKEIATFETIHNYNTRVAIAPDGSLMASWGQHLARGGAGGMDRDAPRTLQLWDLVAGKELKKILLEFGAQGYGQIARAAFSPDGKTIAVMSGRSTFHLIDIETGKETRRFAGHGSINGGGMGGLRFSPDGALLADFEAGGVVQAWEVKSGKRVELEDGPKANILGVAFPGKGRIVALANLAQSLHWWDANLSEQSPFQGHLAAVSGLTFLPDGKSVISAGSDHTVIWWDPKTGKEQRRLTLPDEDARFGGGRGGAVTLAPNGRYAATANNFISNGVRLWNLKTGRPLFDFEGPRTGMAISVAFAQDGSKLAGADSQSPYLWDLTTGQEIATSPRQGNARNFGGGARVAISPDGKVLAVEAQQGQGVELVVWDIELAKEIHRSARGFMNFNGVGAVGGIAFSTDSRVLALAEGGNGIVLLNARTGKETGRIASKNATSFLQLAFSPDGRFLAAGVAPQNFIGVKAIPDEPTVEIWEIVSGQMRSRFTGHTGAVTCLAYSPDGATLASGSMDTTLLLWDLGGASGAKVTPFDDDKLADAWQALATKDPKLDATIRRLVQTPATIAFFSTHLQPAKIVKVDDATLEKLVAELDNANFQKRQAASKELIRLGERAAMVLDQALEQKPSIEAARRMQEVLDTIARREPTPAELQAIRAVEVLERIGSTEARTLLTALSKGDTAARVTQDAAAALKRIR